MNVKYEIEINEVDLNRLDTTIEDLDQAMEFAVSDLFNCSNQFFTIKRSKLV